MKDFQFTIVVSLIGLALAAWLGGPMGVLLALILSVMEVSLSFDNAVLNAVTLRKMDPVWQHRFLTWGIWIAIGLMRLVFPVLIVAVVSKLGMLEVFNMAVREPHRYAEILTSAHITIAAFGGIFLLMVFLKFILDPARDIHWLGSFERKLAAIGKLEAIQIVITLIILLGMQRLIPQHEQTQALIAGLIGLIIYLVINSLTSLLEGGQEMANTLQTSGLMGFIYLEILDASFSFDGVIGAFAITNNIFTIMIGLGIGALFVRSITLLLTRKGTLQKYIYLEHGAHYAIGALAAIMLLGVHFEIPEVVTGLIGVGFIGASFLSSISYNRKAVVSELETLKK